MIEGVLNMVLPAIALGVARWAGGKLLKHWMATAAAGYTAVQYAPETKEAIKNWTGLNLDLKDNLKDAGNKAFEMVTGADPNKGAADIAKDLFTGENPIGYAAIAGIMTYYFGKGTIASIAATAVAYFLAPLITEFVKEKLGFNEDGTPRAKSNDPQADEAPPIPEGYEPAGP